MMPHSSKAENVTPFDPVAKPIDTGDDPKARSFLHVAESGLDTLKEFISNARACLPRAADDSDAKDETSGNTAKARLREFRIEAEAYIRQHPTKAALGAVGLGFVLGILLKR